MFFDWGLSDYKSPQISRTLLSILADLNSAVVCMVSAPPPISKFSNSLSNNLGIVPSAPITNVITIILCCIVTVFIIL